MTRSHLIIYCCVLIFSSAGWSQQQLTFGRFKSRAIFDRASNACPAPLVILVPGSGANGPEEMMPGSMTGDGKDHSLFGSFSAGLRRNGNVATLAIGKPGVEFFKSWDPKDHFYDQDLYQNLHWQDLINNVSDAIAFASTLPCVDSNKITILGHSEGTQVAVDFANQNPTLAKSLILIGFSGENLATTVDWQLFQRDIDAWISPDVDTNQDGYVSKAEAQAWPEFHWHWQQGQDVVSISDIEVALRADQGRQNAYAKMSTAKIWEGVFNRNPIYDEASTLKQDIFVFTGSLDVQTRPQEALLLQKACISKQKINCEVVLVPGLGHGMSLPKEPRKQKLVDATLGPVDESFLQLLQNISSRL